MRCIQCSLVAVVVVVKPATHGSDDTVGPCIAGFTVVDGDDSMIHQRSH